MFAGWDVNRQLCRPDPSLSAVTARFILNSTKSASNPQWVQTFLLLAAQALSVGFAVGPCEERRAASIGAPES